MKRLILLALFSLGANIKAETVDNHFFAELGLQSPTVRGDMALLHAQMILDDPIGRSRFRRFQQYGVFVGTYSRNYDLQDFVNQQRAYLTDFGIQGAWGASLPFGDKASIEVSPEAAIGINWYKRIELQDERSSFGFQPFLSLGLRASFLKKYTCSLSYRAYHDDHESIAGENTVLLSFGMTTDF